MRGCAGLLLKVTILLVLLAALFGMAWAVGGAEGRNYAAWTTCRNAGFDILLRYSDGDWVCYSLETQQSVALEDLADFAEVR